MQLAVPALAQALAEIVLQQAVIAKLATLALAQQVL
jgi:hypothetical protein